MASPTSLVLRRGTFGVYENAAIGTALSARSLRPSFIAFLCIVLVSFSSACTVVALIYKDKSVVKAMRIIGLPQRIASLLAKVLQSSAAFVFLAAMSALCKALSLQAIADSSINAAYKPVKSKGNKSQLSSASTLTEHQQILLGISAGNRAKMDIDKRRKESPVELDSVKQRKTRARSRTGPQSSTLLVPLHHSMSTKNIRISGMSSPSWFGYENRNTSTSNVSSLSPMGANSLAAAFPTLQSSPVKIQSPSTGMNTSPWAKNKSPVVKDEIRSEEMLEEFIVETGEKLVESSLKSTSPQTLATPPPTLQGIGVITPTSVSTAVTSSSNPRSTPLRPLRISPGSQKFGLSPKKSEGDVPPPMSLEQASEAFRKFGIYPQIEQWRDQLRQWFSETLLNPLVLKLDTSHLQVMQAAAKLGLLINVTQVGGNNLNTREQSPSPIDSGSLEWHTTFAPEEDSLLHQLRAALLQACDTPVTQPTMFGLHPTPQVRQVNPAIQECLDAVTEHQRLKALMKGEWAKGLLPQSSVRADYTVQRVRELAEGTCVKNYEYVGTGEVYDNATRRWTLELPTDSHLLIYLFCALLEHPQWMLHVDPTSYPSTHSGNNPLFVASMPPKERFPEKYVAVLSYAPSMLHMGACILVVGKSNPPVYAVYWDKKLQFSLQGRTALWDSILLLCYRIKVAHGSMIRGLNLNSSALNLACIFEASEMDPGGENCT